MVTLRAFLRYLWRSLVPLARTPGIVGWARQAVSVLVLVAAAVGWAIPTDSPLLWITLVACGLAVLFAISGFATYQEAHRGFPRITLEPGMVSYDSVTDRVLIEDMYVTNQETKHKVSLSFKASAWTETPKGITNLWLFLFRSNVGDPLNLGPQEGARCDLLFDVSGEVGDEGPSGYTLTLLERVTQRSVFIAPFPSSYPPSLRDQERPRKARR